jgi:hypothetical protein
MSTTSGSTAIVRAMHSRCACPPDRLRPEAFRRFFTSSHSAEVRENSGYLTGDG